MKIRVKRITAFIIDIMPFVIFLQITAPLLNSNFILFKIPILGTVLAITYYVLLGLAICFKDIIIGYESIGKKIMKLEIVNQEGVKEKDKNILFKRVFYSLFNIFFPLYPYMILFNNKSFGDYKTKLTVRESF